MKTALLQRLSAHPRRWGILFGTVLLPTIKLLFEVLWSWYAALQYDGSWQPESADFVIIGISVLPVFGWGLVLGDFAGRAWEYQQEQKIDSARHALRQTGMWCAALNIAWSIVFAASVIEGRDSPEDDPTLFLLGRQVTNVALHLSIAMFFTSFHWPRHENERVQVTEDLWV